jgi:hypothetical protein
VIGVSRQDITPPPGIYSRCWGASTHDKADGVHRPLTLTTLTLEHQNDGAPPLVMMSAELMSWRSRDAEAAVIGRILSESSLPRERFMFCLTHTHSAPSLREDDKARPGGDLIEPYRQQLVRAGLQSIRSAQVGKCQATLTWRYGKCDLATNRDLLDPAGGRVVCGFNPDASADDTLLVGRVTADDGRHMATIVNYACHATTLGWQNRLLSPDYVGAMREAVETYTNAPCLFVQGASGELAPAEQYSDDPQLADRHGRRLGHAVIAALEAMDPPGRQLCFDRVVESGAPLAVWKQEPANVSNHLSAAMTDVQLPLKPMPSAAELEQQWRQCDDPVLKERLGRKRQVRKVVGDGAVTAMPLWAWRIGDALLVGQPNEAYSRLQIDLRAIFSPRAVAVMNLVNGSAGYLAPRENYPSDAYQIWQSPFAEGAFERVLAAAQETLTRLTVEGANNV